MRRLSVTTLKVGLLALALAAVASMPAAEREKEKNANLIGLTKAQVFAKLGDPRSNIRVGQREVIYFSKVKLTLRNDVVIEIEEVSDEVPGASKRAEAPASTAPAPDAADPGDTGKTRKAGAPQAAGPAPAPLPAQPEPVARSGEPAEAKGGTAAPTANFEIKTVRPPTPVGRGSTPTPKPATKTTTPPVADAGTPAATTAGPLAPKQVMVAPAATPPSTAPASSNPGAALPSTAIVAPASAPPATGAAPPAVAGETTSPALHSTVEEKKESEEAEAPPPKQPPKRKRRFFRPIPEGDEGVNAGDIFTTQTIVFALLAVGAVGYLYWRGRQRRLLLAATTVSSTPFAEAVSADPGAVFTADLLGKLEWKRFEELVAAYYVKTGVIAVRTKTGPESPVHLKISWKGEAKPFACVQCHSNPVGLIKPGMLHALHEELARTEIRRGYVVTNGKFNVEARDFAEEKHFTLLPGDILLEKLNALPPAARAELLQQTTTGDYTTATCPKCDTKMHRADEGWRCAKCDTFLPGKKG